MNQIQWSHPHKGKVTETVCSKHLTDVLGALTVLGMPCQVIDSKLSFCWRCIYDGYDFREWMNNLDET